MGSRPNRRGLKAHCEKPAELDRRDSECKRSEDDLQAERAIEKAAHSFLRKVALTTGAVAKGSASHRSAACLLPHAWIEPQSAVTRHPSPLAGKQEAQATRAMRQLTGQAVRSGLHGASAALAREGAWKGCGRASEGLLEPAGDSECVRRTRRCRQQGRRGAGMGARRCGASVMRDA